MAENVGNIPIVVESPSPLVWEGSRLDRLTLIVTKGCNMKCDYCFEKHDPFQKMSYEIAKKSILEFDPEFIRFFGGEPLMNRPLILRIMKEHPSIKYELVTNGIYLNKLTDDQIKSFHSINISLDGDYSLDSSRWTIYEEYSNVVFQAKRIHTLMGSKVKCNITFQPDSHPDYSIVDRVIDINKLTNIDRFDVNVVVFGADSKYSLKPKGRELFLEWTYLALISSIEAGGLYDIVINEAIFATKDSETSCCSFRSKNQVAVSTDGLQNFCHAAAYYGISASTLIERDKTSNAACIAFQVSADMAGHEIELDTENFSAISKAEQHNSWLYHERNNSKASS